MLSFGISTTVRPIRAREWDFDYSGIVHRTYVGKLSSHNAG